MPGSRARRALRPGKAKAPAAGPQILAQLPTS
jgi:hypothetical protein